MNNLGIIVEYNPFHNGHVFHIDKSKTITNTDNVIAVMSGNFVQRGEPALLNKYARTEIALNNGVDLVLELPTVYSTSSAELFSHAAVSILDKSNIVTSLCFGSESGSIEELQKVAILLNNEPLEFKSALKDALNSGVSFPKAREIALQSVDSNLGKVLSYPNNILGVEYLKSLSKLNSTIKPFTITRNNSNYNDVSLSINTSKITSATSIRSNIKSNINSIEPFVPSDCFDMLVDCVNNKTYPVKDNMINILKYKVLTSSTEQLNNIYDITEGLAHKIVKVLPTAENYDDLISKLKSKRYTQTKIQRAIIHLLLNITDNDMSLYQSINYIPYIRVLGFRKEKSYLLKDLINNSSVPVITNIKNADLSEIGLKMLHDEFVYTNIYNMLIENNFSKKHKNIELSTNNFELRQPLIIL